MTSPYRQLPAVEALVQQANQQANGHAPPHHVLVEAARVALAQARTAIAAGQPVPASTDLAAQTLARAAATLAPSLRTVINASGVIIQTNLGRAPLSVAALLAMHQIGTGYSNLEYDLEAGVRGSRYTHLQQLICQLTGAEAALVVNNNAAAIYLVLMAFASGREVLVSRGQAVEIGGGFRIPDVLRQSGASLVEVGTTNRTYANDYASAITAQTAMLLRIHTSNFRLVGFVHETPLHELVAVGSAHSVLVVDDLGSGSLLDTSVYGLQREPLVQESVAAGADLVTFSGDKLLGGPQAGIIVGRAMLVEQLKRHPLTRALRVDKTTLAALEATLLAYLRGTAQQELPIWQMIAAQPEQLQQRAEQLSRQLGAIGSVVRCVSTVGGGSLPGATMPSYAIALNTPQPDRLAQRLRTGRPAIVPRINDDQVLLDLRTILPEQEPVLVACLHAALQQENQHE